MALTPEATTYSKYPLRLRVAMPKDEVRLPRLPESVPAAPRDGTTHVIHTLLFGKDFAPGKPLYMEERTPVPRTRFEELQAQSPFEVVDPDAYRLFLTAHGIPPAPRERDWGEPMILWVAAERYTAVSSINTDQTQGRVTLVRADVPPASTYRTLATGDELHDGLSTRFDKVAFAWTREDYGAARGKTDFKSLSQFAQHGTPEEEFSLLLSRHRVDARQRFAHIPTGKIIHTHRAPIVHDLRQG